MKVTPEMADDMRRRYAAGESINEIRRLLGVGWQTVQYHLRDEWKEAQKSRVKKCQEAARKKQKPVIEYEPAAAVDPRGLTERVCGDPMPGRSALDARRKPPVVAFGTVEL